MKGLISMHRFEEIEWMDLWWEQTNTPGKRVLLIGDSISRDGYYRYVKERLAGKYLVDRCSLSTGIDSPMLTKAIDMFIKHMGFRYDVIHFNSGAHAGYIPADEFEEHLKDVVFYLRENSPNSRIIIGNCTPNRLDPGPDGFGKYNAVILERNEKYLKVGGELGIEVVDLYQTIIDNNIMNSDGIHFNSDGYKVLGDALAKTILGRQVGIEGKK